MSLAEDMEFYSNQIPDEDYFYNLGKFYHDNYNITTICEAKWKTIDKKEIKFKDMTEEHIHNCIIKFKNNNLLQGAFKLELLRRELNKLGLDMLD